jgi:hypothetical protein
MPMLTSEKQLITSAMTSALSEMAARLIGDESIGGRRKGEGVRG